MRATAIIEIEVSVQCLPDLGNGIVAVQVDRLCGYDGVFSLLLLLGRRFPSPIEAEISLYPVSRFAGPPLWQPGVRPSPKDRSGDRLLSRPF